MISYADDSQKQALIPIWKAAFPNDSDAFVDFYFEKKYRSDNTLLLFKDNKIVSCLQMLPYKMTYYKHFINTAYISGAATLPDCQNQGLMQTLLAHALGEMKKKGNFLTTLIPQTPRLIDFYKKFGYTPCFEYQLTAINPNDYPQFPDKIRFKEFELSDTRLAYLLYNRYLIRKNMCIQKSITDFAVMAQVCQNFDGNVYVLLDKGEMVGVCFCAFSNGMVLLKDCFCAADYRQYFLSKLTQRFNSQIIFASSSRSAETMPTWVSTQGMARILDAPKLLTLFAKAYPQAEFTLKIEDEYILENNLRLIVSHGEVRKDTAQDAATVDFELSIEQLTQLLLGYRTASLEGKYAVFPQQHPYMSLMLE